MSSKDVNGKWDDKGGFFANLSIAIALDLALDLWCSQSIQPPNSLQIFHPSTYRLLLLQIPSHKPYFR
ncbi:MAG: hypothetical protein AAF635_12505 [Cyanobacteria bacterium P01_C01_bin.69]